MSPLTQTSLLLALEQPNGKTLSLPLFPREVEVGKSCVLAIGIQPVLAIGIHSGVWLLITQVQRFSY